MDADERQEYECLRLEGFSEKEARELAHAANDKLNSKRLSGPRSADRVGHGNPPIISDMTNMDIFESAPSVTLDTRTAAEREADYAMVTKVTTYLDLLTPLQREVICDIYGIGTGNPMSYRAVAIKHGHGDHPEWTAKRRQQALDRIRRLLANPPLTEAQKADRLRKRKTAQARRYRARLAERSTKTGV